MTTPDAWDSPQKILVILAHPDDPEFFCGATLARWANAGHHITYALLTCGDKGSDDPDIQPDTLCQLRRTEQQQAAKRIGVEAVHFYNQPDGCLIPDLALRRDVTRIIRRFKPDILVSCDPTNLFPSESYPLNHPDHRAAGQVVLDAVFPAAGSALFFPELLAEGWQPHRPREVWLSVTQQPNVKIDVTDTWETKIEAILQHKSQIGDPQALIERMQQRGRAETDGEIHYEEQFHVIHWRR